jgi:gluconolactonase
LGKINSIILTFVSFLSFTCSEKPIVNPDWELVIDRLQFPEGPAWDGKQHLYVSNCYGGWITRISETKIDTFISADNGLMKQTNGLTWSPSGFLYACDFGLGNILKIDTSGHSEVFIKGYHDRPFNRPNDLILDQTGNLYFTDPSSYGPGKKDGRLFYYDRQLSSLMTVADSLSFPNGLAISPIDQKLYVCESAKNQIIRFAINQDGTLHNKEIFISLPGGDPDGIDFDETGNLYVAHFGSGTVFVISPAGEILQRVKTPGKKPSNLEFAGTDLKTLFLTEDETNAVYKTSVLIAGHRWLIRNLTIGFMG